MRMSSHPATGTPSKKRHSWLQRLLCCSPCISTPPPSPRDVQSASAALSPPAPVAQPQIRAHFIPFEFPWLSTQTPYDYHKDGFWDFPERAGWMLDGKGEHRKLPNGMGWDAADLDGMYKCRQRSIPRETVTCRPPDSLRIKCFRIDGSDSSLAEEVAFLQSWLFFGVLAEIAKILGVETKSGAEFVVRAQDGTNVLSTATLDELPQIWLAALSTCSDANERVRSMLQVVKHAMSFQTVISTRKSDSREPRTLSYRDCRVLLAIRLLFRAILLTLALSKDSDQYKFQFLMSPHLEESFPAAWDELKDYAVEDMLRGGWCKSECKLLEPMDGCYNFFATKLTRWQMDHGKCDDFICRADQVDEKTYQTIHVDPHCRCALVPVEPGDLCKVLEKGEVPRIQITANHTLVVSEDQPYAAISHVWSHGLGNPHENALPLCQVRRLARCVSDLQGAADPPLALWIDTLCIPVQPALKEFRKRAIVLLSRTYTDARVVLVLDQEVQRVDEQRVSLLEERMTIAFAGWTRRLWTLQEAALAEKLYIQTLHGSRLMENSKIETSERDTLISQIRFREGIEGVIRDRIPPISTLRDSVFAKSDSADTPVGALSVATSVFQRLSFAVKHRSTSKMEDEAMILAITLGFDVKQIMDADTLDNKMAKFLTKVREFPSDIIFGDWEKLGNAPYRWAPRSLLRFPTFRLQSFGGPAICDELGLHAAYQGFLFEEGTSSQGPDSEGKLYALDQVSGIGYEFELRNRDTLFAWPENPALVCRPYFIAGDTAVVNIARKIAGSGREGDRNEALDVSVVGYLRLVASGGLDLDLRKVMKGSMTAPEQIWNIT
ncbi:hypothetical protein BOTBODRAFT_149578 [Botryobasidium botryosum FD-172 SS1]|uniref:Heterokaryon incompatibility domain-containing protein n=1 Tax=Botryobasidium botryosum (strain FD-172 SS1) TaxID=930990 RepID=A0A067M487_BOTB1|nr:hypothetical protein BOTBODRAFT_149578 [Botryobasidium botryosum FD-172 SS1]